MGPLSRRKATSLYHRLGGSPAAEGERPEAVKGAHQIEVRASYPTKTTRPVVRAKSQGTQSSGKQEGGEGVFQGTVNSTEKDGAQAKEVPRKERAGAEVKQYQDSSRRGCRSS